MLLAIACIFETSEEQTITFSFGMAFPLPNSGVAVAPTEDSVTIFKGELNLPGDFYKEFHYQPLEEVWRSDRAIAVRYAWLIFHQIKNSFWPGPCISSEKTDLNVHFSCIPSIFYVHLLVSLAPKL